MKIKEKIKSNVKPIAAFMMGAVIFGSIAGVVATTIAASEIAFTPQDSTWNVTTVQGAMDDLYTRQNKYNALLDYSKVADSGITYKYWAFTEVSGYNIIPTTSYSNPNDIYSGGGTPIGTMSYIRTTIINGNAVGHSLCSKYNDKEFCIEPNYWACPLNTKTTDCGLKTMIKLKAAMEAAFGIVPNVCNSNSYGASCSLFGGDGNYYYINNNGNISGNTLDMSMDVYANGEAGWDL